MMQLPFTQFITAKFWGSYDVQTTCSITLYGRHTV